MSKWTKSNEGMLFIDQVFMKAAQIVAGDRWEWRYNPNTREDNYVQPYAGREWFRREYRASNVHDAVLALMTDYRPDNWHQLLLEWPHKSATDPNRIAYTRDERAGEADRQTITTIGKYLTRHFSGVPDYVIRDIVAKYTYGGSTELTHDMDRMVAAVSNGPSSCMTRDFSLLCADQVRRHPYQVYDPSLGWGMAIRTEGGEILGRCLVWTDPDDENNRGFVRSYKRERGYHSHSGRDEAIDAYLTGLGLHRWSDWPDDTPLMKYSLAAGGYLMPYIDGGTQTVDKDSFTIHSSGDISASNTNGMANAYECTCEDCGAGFDDGDGYWVGVFEDRHVCSDCCDNSYMYVYGLRGNQYYLHEDDNYVKVGGEHYDADYLSDNSIVELANGDYEHHDNTAYIESADAYYHVDDEDICYAEDSSQYELRDNCWQCTESGNWYTDDEESVEVGGELYHPDNAPEPETDDTKTETN